MVWTPVRGPGGHPCHSWRNRAVDEHSCYADSNKVESVSVIGKHPVACRELLMPSPEADEQRRAGALAERFSQVATAFAGFATAGRIPPAMLSSHGYQGFRSAPPPSGWIQAGERWARRWNGREVAAAEFDRRPGVRRQRCDVRRAPALQGCLSRPIFY